MVVFHELVGLPDSVYGKRAPLPRVRFALESLITSAAGKGSGSRRTLIPKESSVQLELALELDSKDSNAKRKPS